MSGQSSQPLVRCPEANGRVWRCGWRSVGAGRSPGARIHLTGSQAHPSVPSTVWGVRLHSVYCFVSLHISCPLTSRRLLLSVQTLVQVPFLCHLACLAGSLFLGFFAFPLSSPGFRYYMARCTLILSVPLAALPCFLQDEEGSDQKLLGENPESPSASKEDTLTVINL